ncbi:MAG TPA: LTA synthase family protein, partial [Flavobacterium sp.]
MTFYKKLSPFYNLGIFYCIISFILRIALFFHPITQSSFSFFEILKIVSAGLISDFFVYILMAFFLWLYMIFISNSKYNKPSGYIILGAFIILFLYVASGKSILDEYGGGLPRIALVFIGIKTVLFGLLLFVPKLRNKIRFWLFAFVIFLYVLLILQNGISEFFFWNEFGVKYNFIAVNYLIYTNEVIGNIMQSYPVVPIFSGLFLITGIVTCFILKKSRIYIDEIPNFKTKLKISVIYIVLFLISLVAIPTLAKTENSKNVFVNELQSNGIYKFYLAFQNNKLDYFKFYETLPKEKSFALLKQQFPNISGQNSIQKIKS